MDLNTFLSKENCERCGKELCAKTMSLLNTDAICLECAEEEKGHPFYEQAKEKDFEEYQKGNYYYDGLYSGMQYNDIPFE